jgi:hypothetical protein
LQRRSSTKSNILFGNLGKKEESLIPRCPKFGVFSDPPRTRTPVARYRAMGADLPPETGHAEKLLVLAANWRERADKIADPYHSDVMRRAAEGLEQAAARAKSQTAERN